jgi:hypothetical protein
LDRFAAWSSRVFVGADTDVAAVVRRLHLDRAEGHRLAPAADDERGGQQSGAAHAQVPEEAPTR